MPDRQGEFDGILDVIESFLMRRMICGLTPKNYNRLFVDLIRHVEKSADVSLESVAAFLTRGTGDSVRFPSDEEFAIAAAALPLYGRLAHYKVRAILEALDNFAYHSKSEPQALPPGLEIEHVLPRSWESHWPLSFAADGSASTAARRAALVNTLGNLTLITGSLNPSLSNSAWAVKRPELLKFSKLNLTRYFHGKEAEIWDEAAIEARTQVLSQQLVAIWPAPQTPSSPAGS
jgi:hypothetical protein